MLIVGKLQGLILDMPREKVVWNKLEEMRGMGGMERMERMEIIKGRKITKNNLRVGSKYMGK